MEHLCIQLHNYVVTWVWVCNSAKLLNSTCRITNMTWLNSRIFWRMWFVEGAWYDYSWCYRSELVTCLQSSNLVILKLRYINCVSSFTLKLHYINLLIVFGLSQNRSWRSQCLLSLVIFKVFKHHGVYYLWSLNI